MNNVLKLIYVRRATGIYFLFILAFLFVMREEVYFSPGETVVPSLSFIRLFGCATEVQIYFAFIVSSLAAILFTFGFLQQITALIMFLALNFLIQANTLLMEIHYTYLGWMLLVFVFSPTFKPLASLEWWADRVTLMALYALGISFTYLGIVKLTYSSYYGPSLINFLFSIPDAHPHNVGYFNFLNLFLKNHLPDSLKIILGLAGAAAEFVILPLVIFKQTRPLAHLLVFLVLLFIMFFVNYWHISLLMMIFQAMALDVNQLRVSSFLKR